MRFQVVYLDGTETEVVRTASALRAFEAKHKQALPVAMATGRSYWADELAHHSLRQLTDEDRDFDTWIEEVETVKMERPAGEILAVADAFGFVIPDVEREALAAVAADPTGGAAEVPSPADS